MSDNQLLEVQNLHTGFRLKDDYYDAVDDVSFTLDKNEILAIVGESGCGKSTLATTIMGLLDPNNTKITGEILYNDLNLIDLNETLYNKIRGNDIGMIFQDPLSALNPLMRIEDQIKEGLSYHTKMNAEQRQARALELLEQVGIPNPARVGRQYPHELSGGMRQRVIIAIAIACKPPIVIADEPTTALDVTIRAQILDLLKDLQEETKTGIILITHDLGVVAEMADRVAVMYGGQFVEVAGVKELFDHPKHPYTRSLLNSIPQEGNHDAELHVIEGVVPSLKNMPRKGCRFAPRIPWIPASDHEEEPILHEVAPNHLVRCSCYKHFHFRDEKGEVEMTELITIKDLKVHYPIRSGFFNRVTDHVYAVDGVDFIIEKGKTYGLVGESGSGKSTTGKAVVGLEKVTAGQIMYEGKDVTKRSNRKKMGYNKDVQMIFQDSMSSLNPKKRVLDIIAEPIRNFERLSDQEEKKKVKGLLDIVGMPEDALYKYPHEFSGGQRQRLGVARAVATNPKLIVADEPVSALDLSVQAQVLNFMKRIQQEYGLSYLFISHDLGVVKHMCDNIAIMYKGRFVEIGTREDIYNDPRHIYTKRLLSAIPQIDVENRESHKENRRRVEQEYIQNQKEYYDATGRVYDLRTITTTHKVALKDGGAS